MAEKYERTKPRINTGTIELKEGVEMVMPGDNIAYSNG